MSSPEITPVAHSSASSPENVNLLKPLNATTSNYAGVIGVLKHAGLTSLVAGAINFTVSKVSPILIGSTVSFGPTLATGGIAGIIVIVAEVASYALKILGDFLAQNFPSNSGKNFIKNSMATVKDNKLANYAVKGLLVGGSALAISTLSPLAGVTLTAITIAKIAGATFLVNEFVRPHVQQLLKI